MNYQNFKRCVRSYAPTFRRVTISSQVYGDLSVVYAGSEYDPSPSNDPDSPQTSFHTRCNAILVKFRDIGSNRYLTEVMPVPSKNYR
jgi:hypothetical protein